MNKGFFSILFVACLAISLGSCSSGAYVANPASNANQSINPLNPLTAKQFTWTGNGSKVSMNVNGNQWSTDTAGVSYVDSLHTNVLWAYANGKELVMYIQDGWANNIYNMGFKKYDYLAIWSDGVVFANAAYQSALGNSGELYMTANDSVNFCGKFYFQGVNDSNSIANITQGIFTLTK